MFGRKTVHVGVLFFGQEWFWAEMLMLSVVIVGFFVVSVWLTGKLCCRSRLIRSIALIVADCVVVCAHGVVSDCCVARRLACVFLFCHAF